MYWHVTADLGLNNGQKTKPDLWKAVEQTAHY